MIYQINSKDLYKTLLEATIVCWSFDGAYVLVSAANSLSSVTPLETYTNDELSSIMSMPLWKQPCISC